MVVALSQLTQLLNETYATTPIVCSYAIPRLEAKVYDTTNLDLKEILTDVDNIFPIDKPSSYDRVLASIECTPVSQTGFNLKFNIVNGS